MTVLAKSRALYLLTWPFSTLKRFVVKYYEVQCIFKRESHQVINSTKVPQSRSLYYYSKQQ